MAFKLETIYTPGIAQLSYLIGDTGAGTAAVIDPRADVDVYLDLARAGNLRITHILETHIHADFMSGARELKARLDDAEIYVSGEGNPQYGYEHALVRDGDTFAFGDTVLTARHTPGHTPEHVSYLAASAAQRDAPWGVFTGDALFVGSAGRPDLLGHERAGPLAEQLFETLRGFYLKLDDHVLVYPGHGAGSACGAAISDRLISAIGYERRFNPFLQFDDMEAFRRFVLEGAPPEPAHYRRLKQVNGAGPPVLGGLPRVRPLAPDAFQAAAQAGDAVLLDVRSMLAFGGGHIAGAVNIGDQPMLSVWAGDMLDPQRPLLLVLERAADLEQVVRRLLRTGFTRFTGYLAGGMEAWANAGLPMSDLAQMSVHALRDRAADVQVLDVRSPAEWRGGRIPGAVHHYVGDLRLGQDGLPDLDPQRPVVAYCGSGYRASIAASLLAARGFADVRNVPGSFSAWKRAGYPVEQPAPQPQR